MKNYELLQSHIEWLRGDHEFCNPWLAAEIATLIEDLYELQNQNDSLKHSIAVLEGRVAELMIEDIRDV